MARAGDRGGARADKPRWVRILAITGDASMAAMIPCSSVPSEFRRAAHRKAGGSEPAGERPIPSSVPRLSPLIDASDPRRRDSVTLISSAMLGPIVHELG